MKSNEKQSINHWRSVAKFACDATNRQRFDCRAWPRTAWPCRRASRSRRAWRPDSIRRARKSRPCWRPRRTWTSAREISASVTLVEDDSGETSHLEPVGGPLQCALLHHGQDVGRAGVLFEARQARGEVVQHLNWSEWPVRAVRSGKGARTAVTFQSRSWNMGWVWSESNSSRRCSSAYTSWALWRSWPVRQLFTTSISIRIASSSAVTLCSWTTHPLTADRENTPTTPTLSFAPSAVCVPSDSTNRLCFLHSCSNRLNLFHVALSLSSCFPSKFPTISDVKLIAHPISCWQTRGCSCLKCADMLASAAKQLVCKYLSWIANRFTEVTIRFDSCSTFTLDVLCWMVLRRTSTISPPSVSPV